jgi:anti-anti-sigma factor
VNDEIPVVRLDGELEITRAPAIREQLMNAVENRHAGLVADLSGAEYLDSAGVNVLFEVAESLREHQIVMALVVPSNSLVDKVVSLVNLSSVAPVKRDVEDALRHIRRSA